MTGAAVFQGADVFEFRPQAATSELVLTGARLVLDDEVVAGSLRIADGVIRSIDQGRSSLSGAVDLEGDLLIPGLIDLHTDNLEKHYQPRIGVQWDPVHAAISHDVQVIGSGITTVFDSITIGAAEGWDARSDWVEPMLQGLDEARAHDMLKAEHLLHLRAEVTHEQILEIFEHHAAKRPVRFLSLMDHAPGDRQSPDVEDYRARCLKMFDDPAAVEHHIARLLHASEHLAPDHRRRLAEIAAEWRIPLATHDDASRAHVLDAVALGAVLSEFPTTPEAAAAARRHGLHVLMGSPNLIRGGSHSGNVAAGDLARADLLDILSSDYIPASLVLGAFKLTSPAFAWSLPAVVATVTRIPAEAAGLDDRGAIRAGLRADLVRVRQVGERPVVRSVWRAGGRVA